jgi:flagellar protein FliO/FliZ
MDAASLLRTMGSLGAVLGLLCLALWTIRRYNICLPGTVPARGERRLAVIERIALDHRRSVALIRRDGREHLILIAPEGHQIVESGIEAPPPPPQLAAGPSDFASILAATTAAQDRVTPARDAAALVRTLAARLAPLVSRFHAHTRRLATNLAHGAATHRARARAKAVQAQPTPIAPLLGAPAVAPAPKPHASRPAKPHRPTAKRAPKQVRARG